MVKNRKHTRIVCETTTIQLTGTEQMSSHYLQTCTYAYNSFASPALNSLSQF